MREVIPFLGLMKETAGLFGLLTRDTVFCCTFWEDDESCITVAKNPKFIPRTKHIAIKYHHFRRFFVMELSSSSPLIRLSKLQISSPSPCERRVSVSCSIILWFGDSIGIPVGTWRKCYTTHYLSFPCLLSLRFQGECENISNEFQIYFETHFLLLETLLDRNKLNSSLSCRTQFAKRILDK